MNIKQVTCLLTTIICMNMLSFASEKTDAAAPIDEQVAQLKSLVNQAKSLGHDVERELLVLQTSKIFDKWIAWDEANVKTNAQFYAAHHEYKKDPLVHAKALPIFERQSVKTLISEAIAELSQVLNGQIKRKPTLLTDTSKVTIDNGQFVQEGKPVFVSTYVWKPSDPDTNKYFGNLNSQFFAPAHVTGKNGGVDQSKIKSIKKQQNEQRIGQVFVSHTAIPQWATDTYENFDLGSRRFHKFDIDNPNARFIYKEMFDGLIPHVKNQRMSELGYMLFNEPTFHTQENTWNTGPVSDYTMEKFKHWLSARHENIGQLNALWNKNYASFDEIDLSIPISVDLKGSPSWFDWTKFNQVRVTDWFAFLNDAVKRRDESAKTHIKLMPHTWLSNMRDHGLDFEALLAQGDIIGFDASSQYEHGWKTMHFEEHYSFDWFEPVISFDFFTSLHPKQLLWDSENHFIMTTGFLPKNVRRDYVKTIYWLAATHGLSGVNTWVWGRNEDGSTMKRGEYSSSHIVSATQQPFLLHDIARTYIDLNAHGEDIVRLQRQAKPIRIFYSETSALAQNKYMDDIQATYEKLHFDGIALGFATETILNRKIDDWAMLVINDSTQVTQSERQAILDYVNRGGIALIHKNSLLKDEYGRSFPPMSADVLQKFVQFESLDEMHSLVIHHAEKTNNLPIITVKQSSQQQVKTVAWRLAQREDGSHVMMITNYGKMPANVTIDHRNSSLNTVAKNLYTGNVQDNSFNLAPMEHKFMSLTTVQRN
ncbi:beta-galactosidase [Agaribacter marinus]|uniref:Glycoside hydrolase family 42 N-terminal domain-containing protein n=1 Tax=Agaribacter marinus TaxID=1431249 RepID=A0AA37SWB3_9ALTE|nr:beta-galactosidase [Agaribacter marinus]GLR69809.1 hypothetical protein GCM10007852_07170 [Agaribacter marinus]